MVTACVGRFKRYKILHSAHGTFVCCVWVSKQAAIISLDITDRMVFYNQEEIYLLRGTNWIFKYNSVNISL
jgi:hypothetical protein